MKLHNHDIFYNVCCEEIKERKSFCRCCCAENKEQYFAPNLLRAKSAGTSDLIGPHGQM